MSLFDEHRKYIKTLDEMDILTTEKKKEVLGKIEDIFAIINSREKRNGVEVETLFLH